MHPRTTAPAQPPSRAWHVSRENGQGALEIPDAYWDLHALADLYNRISKESGSEPACVAKRPLHAVPGAGALALQGGRAPGR